MTFPTLAVQLALSTRPTEAATWTDVTAYVLSVVTRRGRESEFGPMGLGTCEVVLDNSDRRFDPASTLDTNSPDTVAPYYPNLKPLRRLRIQAVHESTTYDVFYGYVDGWPQTWLNGIVPVVNLRACDGFKILSLLDLNETYAEESSSTRVDNVLNDAGWTLGLAWVLNSATNSQLGTTTILGPLGDRLLAGGNSTLAAQTVVDANALQYLNDITESEYGLLYMGKDGVLYFRNRYYSYGTTSAGTFGDAPGELNYADYQLTYDDQSIYNDIRMARIDGPLQTADDATSQLDYFKRTLQNDRLLLSSDDVVADRVNYLVSRYKEPHYRSPSLLLAGYGDTDQMTQMLAREIGDRITVIRRPMGGEEIEIQYRIEGIEQQIGPHGRHWQTRFMLSTADAGSYWLIAGAEGDEWSSQSILDSTTVLAY